MAKPIAQIDLWTIAIWPVWHAYEFWDGGNGPAEKQQHCTVKRQSGHVAGPQGKTCCAGGPGACRQWGKCNSLVMPASWWGIQVLTWGRQANYSYSSFSPAHPHLSVYTESRWWYDRTRPAMELCSSSFAHLIHSLIKVLAWKDEWCKTSIFDAMCMEQNPATLFHGKFPQRLFVTSNRLSMCRQQDVV